jgi:hypothetical protein
VENAAMSARAYRRTFMAPAGVREGRRPRSNAEAA